MHALRTDAAVAGSGVERRAAELFEQSRTVIHQRTDRLFAGLMIVQWLGGIAAAVWISPQTWIGATRSIHWHVYAAIFLGSAITSLPVWLAWKQPGQVLTRHVIAVAQMLTSALLIHVTGGRIETHFHVFGSLAFLAIYRDWRVLVTATVVVSLDHMARGLFWPQSVFGVLAGSSWRWLEHAGWVLFEDTFLIISLRQAVEDMQDVARRRADLEAVNAGIELEVAVRTKELTEAHQKLQASEARMRLILETVPECVKLVAADGTLLEMNPAGLGVLELERLDQVVGRSVYELLPAKYQPGFRALSEAVFRGEAGRLEYELVGRKGTHRWLETHACPLRDQAGRIVAHLAVSRDISENKLAEAALRDSEQRYRQLVQVLPAAIYTCDAEGRITLFNDAAVALWGREPELGKDLWCGSWKIFAPDGSPIPLEDCPMAIAFREGRSIRGREIVVERPDGTRRFVQPHPDPILDRNGKVVGAVNMLVDLTQRKAAEDQLLQLHQQLQESSRQAGMAEMATGVLHNVGNVLNSVNVAANCLADGVRKSKAPNLARVASLFRTHEADLGSFLTRDEKGRQVPGYLAQLAEHLKVEQAGAQQGLVELQLHIDHIKDIVAAQQSLAKLSGVTEIVEAPELVEAALRLNEGSLTSHGVQVLKEFEPGPPITVVKHRALQILVNLMQNAKQACKAGAEVPKQLTLRVRHGAGRVQISVGDNGVGIPRENLDRIFNHGFTTKKTGHGFGLHSAANAVREMGGSLRVDSQGAGLGATFTLELPHTTGPQSTVKMEANPADVIAIGATARPAHANDTSE